jgi:hypothetical protein
VHVCTLGGASSSFHRHLQAVSQIQNPAIFVVVAVRNSSQRNSPFAKALHEAVGSHSPRPRALSRFNLFYARGNSFDSTAFTSARLHLGRCLLLLSSSFTGSVANTELLGVTPPDRERFRVLTCSTPRSHLPSRACTSVLPGDCSYSSKSHTSLHDYPLRT